VPGEKRSGSFFILTLKVKLVIAIEQVPQTLFVLKVYLQVLQSYENGEKLIDTNKCSCFRTINTNQKKDPYPSQSKTKLIHQRKILEIPKIK